MGYNSILCIFIGVLLCSQYPLIQCKPFNWNIFNLKHHWPLNLFHKEDTSFKYPSYVPGHVVQVIPKYPVWKIHKYNGVQLKPVSSLPALQIVAPNNSAKKDFSNLPPIEEIQNILGATSVVETVGMLKELASTEDGRNVMTNYIKSSFPNLDISSNDIISAIKYYESNIIKHPYQLLNIKPIISVFESGSNRPTSYISQNLNTAVSPNQFENNRIVSNTVIKNTQLTPVNSEPNEKLSSQIAQNINTFTPYNIRPSSNIKVANINGQSYLWVPKGMFPDSTIINAPKNTLNHQESTTTPVKYVNSQHSNNVVTNTNIEPIVVQEENKLEDTFITSDFGNNYNESNEISIKSTQQNVNGIGDTYKITNENQNINDNFIQVQKYEYPNFSYTQYSNIPKTQDVGGANIIESNSITAAVDSVPKIESYFVVPKLNEMKNFAPVDSKNYFQNIKFSNPTPSSHFASDLPIELPSSGVKFNQFEDKIITPLIGNVNTENIIESVFLKPQEEIHNHAGFVPVKNTNKYMFVVENTNANQDGSNEIKVIREKISNNGRIVNSLNYEYPNLSYTQLSEIPLENNVLPSNPVSSYDVPVSGQFEDIEAAGSENVIVTKLVPPDNIKGDSVKHLVNKTSDQRLNPEHLQDTVVVYGIPQDPAQQM